jgi:hypothetical protein
LLFYEGSWLDGSMRFFRQILINHDYLGPYSLLFPLALKDSSSSRGS